MRGVEIYKTLKSTDTIVGIDPGLGGGIAYWRDGIIKAVTMPRGLSELNSFLAYLREISENPIVFIEHVQMRPQDSQGGKQFGIVKMLKQYNELCAYLKSNHLPYIQTMPITWQTRLKVHQRGEEYTKRKSRYNKIAKEWHPEVKITGKTCDAVLILRFGRMMLSSQPDWVVERYPLDFKLF